MRIHINTHTNFQAVCERECECVWPSSGVEKKKMDGTGERQRKSEEVELRRSTVKEEKPWMKVLLNTVTYGYFIRKRC